MAEFCEEGRVGMALRFLLDSDVIIWHLRGHEPTEFLLEDLEVEQPLGCSALSTFEVWAGVRRKEMDRTREFLSALRVVPVGESIALKAGEYWREFRRKGVTLGKADALIAATAHVLRLVLVTYNPDYYPMKDVTLYEPMPQV